MFLKRIELVNFKCHTRLKLDFTSDVKKKGIRKTTFMLGENGTGKSALLKAIALITAGSSALGEILGNPDEWIKNGQKSCQINATIVTANGKERDISLKILKGYSLKHIIQANEVTLELIDNAIANADRNYFVVAYGASRRLNKGENKFASQNYFSTNRATCVQSLFNGDATLISLASWAMELEYKTFDKKSAKGAMDIVQSTLDSFFVDNVKFKSIDREKGQLIFTTPDGDVPLSQLSDGYQNVAAWVGDLMYNITRAFGDYSEPMNARGLLLIDEIDLHLHPRWQRQLYDFLKAKLPNFQIVATTHSPLTAQQTEAGELYALKKGQQKISLIPFTGDPSKMLIHQILMSPVFGLPTDESLKIEQAKTIVREQDLKGKSGSESMAVIESRKILQDNPINLRSNGVPVSDMALLKRINEELSNSARTQAKPVKAIALSRKAPAKKTAKKLPSRSAKK